MNLLTNYVLLVSELLLGYEEALWPKKLRSSDFGSFCGPRLKSQLIAFESQLQLCCEKYQTS